MTKKTIQILLLHFCFAARYACSQQPIGNFAQLQINVDNNSELKIHDCARWYIDFSRIKNTVVFKDWIISAGHNGGFSCLRSDNLRIDKPFQNILNSDFFTNVSVVDDTLYTEKFGEIYYWDDTTWNKHPNSLPIDYFSVLFEDNSYIFYSTNKGEFGSMLWVYIKKTGITKAIYVTEPRSVVKTKSGFLIGAHLPDYYGWASVFHIQNVENLNTIDPALRFANRRYDLDPNFAQTRNLDDAYKSTLSEYVFNRNENSIICASFVQNSEIYHLMSPVESWQYSPSAEYTSIGKLVYEDLVITDKLIVPVKPKTIKTYGRITTINEPFYGNGFSIIRNDTIFNISYTNIHPNYNGFKLRPYQLDTEEKWEIKNDLRYTFNWNIDGILSSSDQTEREIHYLYSNHIIQGNYGNNRSANYIDNQSIGFVDRWNFIERIFEYDSRLFVFFGNLGNIGFKYGLVEITNIEKFKLIFEQK